MNRVTGVDARPVPIVPHQTRQFARSPLDLGVANSMPEFSDAARIVGAGSREATNAWIGAVREYLRQGGMLPDTDPDPEVPQLEFGVVPDIFGGGRIRAVDFHDLSVMSLARYVSRMDRLADGRSVTKTLAQHAARGVGAVTLEIYRQVVRAKLPK